MLYEVKITGKSIKNEKSHLNDIYSPVSLYILTYRNNIVVPDRQMMTEKNYTKVEHDIFPYQITSNGDSVIWDEPS